MIEPSQGKTDPSLEPPTNLSGDEGKVPAEQPPTLRREAPHSLGGFDRVNHEVTSVDLRGGGRSGPVGSYPDRVGKFEILEEIARGGMGVVFKARDETLLRIVALKMILHGQLAGVENLQRFELEAKAAGQLQHPGIVAIFGVHSHEGQPFFAMEFVDGSSLAQRVESGPLPSLTAANYLEQTARAVHFAHTKGILHRDLKPANVLLDEYDRPKVTDFGLAKIIQSDSRQTRTGAIMGTPSYMAPEQALAEKNLGPACDVYSLGAILYEMLTGRPPFQGETPMATMTQVIENDPVPPRLLNPKVDRDLETICLKCLEKRQSARYLSAEALADDLKNYLEGQPINARRLGFLGRADKWCRRKPTAAALAALSVLMVLGVIGGAAAFGVVQHQNFLRESDLRAEALNEARKAKDALALVQEAQRREKAQNEVSRHLLYAAQYRLARNAWEAADIQRALSWLKPWQKKVEDRRDPRGWEWYFLRDMCSGKNALPIPGSKVTALAFSPDGQHLATTTHESGIVQLWDVATGQNIRTIRAQDFIIWSLAYSHDGRLAVATGVKPKPPFMDKKKPEVKVWDVEKSQEVYSLLGHDDVVQAIAFSADGRHLATACDDRSVRLWDARTGQLVHTHRGHQAEVKALAFSADGRRLASAANNLGDGVYEVKVWPVDQEREPLTLAHPRPVLALAFSIDGSRVVTAAADQTARLWDAVKGKELRSFALAPNGTTTIAISPDGEKLAQCGTDLVVHLWDVATGKERFSSRWFMQSISRTFQNPVSAMAFSPDSKRLVCASENMVWLGHGLGGQESFALEGHRHSVRALAFHPGGMLLSGGEDGVRIHDLARRTPRPILQNLTGVTTAAYSPQGDLLALAFRDKTVRLYDGAGGKELAVLRGHRGVVRALAFSGDGEVLATGGDDAAIGLWDVATHRRFFTFEPPSPNKPNQANHHTSGVVSLAFSRDGILASAGSGDDTVRLWDIAGRRLKRVLKGHSNGVVTLAFNPRGNHLASGSFDRTIRLWDLSSSEEPFTLQGHTKVVNSICFSADGTRLVSGSGDYTVRIWDMVTHQELLKLDSGESLCVAIHPSGRIASAGYDRLVRIWEANLKDEKIAR